MASEQEAERIYVERVAPLLDQIAELAVGQDMPFVFSLQLTPYDADGSAWFHTTSFLPEGCSEKLTRVKRFLVPVPLLQVAEKEARPSPSLFTAEWDTLSQKMRASDGE